MSALTYLKIGKEIRLVKGFWKQSRATQGERKCVVCNIERCSRYSAAGERGRASLYCKCVHVCVSPKASHSDWAVDRVINWQRVGETTIYCPPPLHSHLDKIYFRHTTLSKSKTLFNEVKWGLTYNPITVAFFFNVFETNKNAPGSYVVDTGDPTHLSIYSTDYFSAINTRIQTGTNHCSSAPNIKLLLQLKSHTHCSYMHILLFLHKKGTRLVLA